MPLDHPVTVGWLLAGLLLIVLLLLCVTGPARRKIRWVVLFLGLSLTFHLVAKLCPRDGTARLTLELSAIFLLTSALGLGVFLLLTQSHLSRAYLRPLPQIFIDIVHTVVYVIAVLVTLGAAGIKPGELFAGSALLTAIVALSLRDTLGNMFAGLAIQAQRPFEVGDWIQFNQDATQVGQVVEINWRATRVVTPDQVEITLPNGLLAQAPIINYSRAAHGLRRAVAVHIPFEVPPQRAKKIILTALGDIPGILPEPAPTASTSGFDDRGVQLSVRFCIADFAQRGKIESAVRDHIWYALNREGISLPVPPRAVQIQKAGTGAAARREKQRIERQEKALRCVEFFARLPEESRRRLAALVHTRLYAREEIIIRQGETGDELFILDRGEVEVAVQRPNAQSCAVARLGPGSFFGEMAALTGALRQATVRALEECEVLVIGKSALAQLFESVPELAEHVSQTLARRQVGLNAKLAEPVPAATVEEHSQWFLERIKEFFSI